MNTLIWPLIELAILLEKYANATILSGTVMHDKLDKTPKVVEFYPEEVDKMLGIKIDEEDYEA